MTYPKALYILIALTVMWISFISSSRGASVAGSETTPATEEDTSPNTIPIACQGNWDGLDTDARRKCIQAELRDTDRQREEILATVARINALIQLIRMQELVRHISEDMPYIPLRTQNQDIREGVVYDSHHNPLSEETVNEH